MYILLYNMGLNISDKFNTYTPPNHNVEMRPIFYIKVPRTYYIFVALRSHGYNVNRQPKYSVFLFDKNYISYPGFFYSEKTIAREQAFINSRF